MAFRLGALRSCMWAELFERASEHETTVEEIRDCLRTHRERDDAE